MELPFEPDSAVLRRVLAHGVFAEKAVALSAGAQAAKVFPALLVGCTVVLKPSEVRN